MRLDFWKKKRRKKQGSVGSEEPSATPRPPEERFARKDITGPSKIGALERQLYAREEPGELKERVLDLERSGTHREPKVRKQTAPSVSESELVNVIEERTAKRNTFLRWAAIAGAGMLILGLAVAATVGFRSLRQVNEDQILITVDAPSEFTAGEEITYTITYGNDSFVDWKNVELVVKPPQGFRLRSSDPQMRKEGRQFMVTIGDLPSGEQGQATVTGQLLGEQNSVALAQVELHISPENFEKARFSRSVGIPTTIVAVPVEISVESANNAAEGERMVAIMKIRNTSRVALENVLLRVDMPDGTQLATEDSEFSREFSATNSWWSIPVLQPLEDVSRVAVLYVEGQPGERRTIVVEGLVQEQENLYLLRQVSHIVTISSSELAISQTFNGSDKTQTVVAGQHMKGMVQYRNIGTTGLKNVIVVVRFEGDGFDPATIRLPMGGAYDPNARTITWTAASVVGLETVLPQQGGELTYEFAMLPTEQLPASGNTKNSILVVTATVDSPDLPAPTGQERRVISDRFELPITTNLTLDVDSFYDDGRLGLPSSGPLPPRVGEQTTYTVRLRVGSTLNDVGEVRVRAVLPDGVQYMDKMYKTEGEMDVNERTGEVIWTIPLVEGLTGRSLPTPELHIHVGITPGENLRGTAVDLLNSASASGLDLFTDATVSAEVEKLPSTETSVDDKKQGIVE